MLHISSFALKACREHVSREICLKLPPSCRGLLGDMMTPHYFRTFGNFRFEATLWIHDADHDLVQEHAFICSFDMLKDEWDQRCWIKAGMPADCRVTPVDPAPVFLVLPRPHVIISATFDPFEIPVLCLVIHDGRRNLVSLLLSLRYPPVGVAAFFTLVLPQHDCPESSECYLIHDRNRYEFWHYRNPTWRVCHAL